MATVELPYGNTRMVLEVPDKNLSQIILPSEPDITESEGEILKGALNNPINNKSLQEIADSKSSVAIIVSDATRASPTKKMLPPLFEKLHEAGVRDENITIIFALGLHRKQSEEEMRYIVGDDIYERIRCIEHDRSRCRRVGVTSAGTPVEVFEEVLDSDIIICTGNIELHYYAGYSGGAKAILPGVSSEESVIANHRLMVNERATSGNIESPVRIDMEDAINFVKVDFLFNAIIDSKKNIVAATAGHIIDAHRKGVEVVDQMYKVEVEPADIVIVSAGGYPKDINLYQAQKALENAKSAVKEGGSILMVAECKDGFGNAIYEKWNRELKTPDDVLNKFHHSFELGGHKAAFVAQLTKKSKLYLSSDLPEVDVRNAFCVPFKGIQEQLDDLLEDCPDAKVHIMPYGGLTLPVSTATAR
ncbi:Protein of unknown function DUF2088 [Methanosalsum zhilinae DSM 4017]|uniref:Uncharacterized protein n=1 Tax=Methanosalsum zhilinae (strain DSM 4017 / NBRC 107636 / OCM 62 / WeN5) TaxID=679901 RepID=F7XKB0_METZD|nr:nickel-dependent lactate racemase [Methanosalsum zhilinae]AEH60579.1 Protein of unknown function DUF2088 [Methanosalsum zhilinae DSM 4017]